jgi:hypothetical protein
MLDGNTDPKPDNQEETQEWIGSLPEDLRSPDVLPTLNKFRLADGEKPVAMPASVVKSYIEAQKKIGQKGVLIPGENASEEDRNVFFKALGRPDRPEDYGFKKPENLPQGVNYNEERVGKFAKVFHQLGMSKDTAQKLLDTYNNDIIEEVANQQKMVEEFKVNAVKELKKEWGSNFEKNISKANAAVKLFGGKDFTELLKNTGLDSHPTMVKVFEKIADRMGEASLVDGYVETNRPVLTRNKLEQMMKDPRYSGREWDRDPDYIKTVQEGWKIVTAEEATR